MKVVDTVRDSVLEDIKKKAAENRQKDLEQTLDFFLAHVKSHSSVVAMFPCTMPDAPHNPKSTGIDLFLLLRLCLCAILIDTDSSFVMCSCRRPCCKF